MPRQGRRPADLVGLLARLLLAAILLYAGGLKVAYPAQSALATRAYQLLPYDVAGYVGYALPFVEIAVGLLLLVGVLTRFAAALAALLMVAFLIGIVSVWVRGISIDCGCFGGGGTIAASQTHYLEELLRDTGLLLCAAWLLWRPRSSYSLDQRLYG